MKRLIFYISLLICHQSYAEPQLHLSDLIQYYRDNVRALELVIENIEDLEPQVDNVKSATQVHQDKLDIINNDIAKTNERISTINNTIDTAIDEELQLLIKISNQAETSFSQTELEKLEKTYRMIRKEHISKRNLDGLKYEISSTESLIEKISYLKDLIMDYQSRATNLAMDYSNWYQALLDKKNEIESLALQITDSEKYSQVISKANSLSSDIPSLAQYENLHNELKSENGRIKFLKDQLIDFQENINKISARNHISPEEAQTYYEARQALIQGFSSVTGYLVAFENMLDIQLSLRLKHTELVRKYLIATANTSLHTHNSETANSIITSAFQSENDNNVYGQTIAKLDSAKSEIDQYQSSFMAYRSARMKSMAMLSFIKRTTENLSNLSISNNMRSVLAAELANYESIFQSKLSQSVSKLANENYYNDRRNLYFSRFLERYRDRLTPSCIALVEESLNMIAASLSHEANYIDFRRNCI